MLQLLARGKSAFISLYKKVRNAGRKKQLIGAVVLLVALVIVFNLGSSEEIEDAAPQKRAVEIATVASLTSDRSALPLLGSVRSETEATILTESQGRITSVSYDLGDAVVAGSIIAQIENNSERASLLQAQGSFASAEANLEKVSRGTLREQGEVRLDAVTAYRDAFTLADDAVLGKTDPFFTGARSSSPQINIATFGDTEIGRDRGKINDLLANWRQQATFITAQSDLFALLNQAENDLNVIKDFLNRLSSAVNRQEANVSDANKAAVLTARTSVNTAISSIIAARNDLNSTLLVGEQISGTGESDATIAVAEAALTQAEGALQVARANFEKTLIRAPISGTINAIDLEVGDFVGTFEPVVTIANNNALEIIAFITEADRSDISVGNVAEIEEAYKGVVTRVAPALDPKTKKIEVRIGITEGSTSLTTGESVEVRLARGVTNTLLDPSQLTRPFAIPISALKITSSEVLVFTVDTENKLVAHPVREGAIIGEKILIEEGLTANMEIVLDARGLKVGQEVIVQ